VDLALLWADQHREGFKDDAYTQLTLAVYTEADPAKLKQAYRAWNDSNPLQFSALDRVAG